MSTLGRKEGESFNLQYCVMCSKGKEASKRAQFDRSKVERRLPLDFPLVPCALKEGVKQILGPEHIGEGGRVRLQASGVRNVLKGRGGLKESTIFFNKGSLLPFNALFILG